MKKKPEICTRQGKSNNNIKSFLSNLDDLHFENNQITQCVFLGILRLKPVPCVVVENKSKKYKNNNSAKEVNKNISSKKDINKVISGKIRKKNIDRIKASVKKLPTKKPVIKIKLNMNKNKKDIVNITPDSLTKITPDTMIQNKTITLNPIQTVSTFNPVQNLFDKLKQQMDDKYNRPGCSEVTKEILFSSEVIADNQKNKRTKKIMKKKPIFERLVMPLLPSNVSFSDNGYHSSTSNNKSNDDVIVINEEIESSGDEQKVFINTVTLPDFELCSSTIKSDNNDIVLIDDSSNRELTVIDDSRNIRTSPRLNRNDPNQDKTNLIIEENKTQSETCKNSSEKPRKRRTLLPTIPLNFFNTPMLLRSELAQKKGGSTENRPSSRGSTSKMQRSDVRQEKSSVKQRKSRNSTENLIYEVVKSSTAIPEHNPTESTVISTKNDIILVDNCSPPKVEPLIIKLKVSQNKNTNEEMESTENKNKFQKAEVTKNLFFPRLLRSDVNQQKTNKDDIAVKKILKTTDSAVISPGKISVKPDSYLKEKLPKKELFVENEQIQNTTKEKLNNNNKIEKSPESPQRRHLRSDLLHETIINTDEESNETTVIITFENDVQTTSEPSVSNIDKTLQNQENAEPRTIQNQTKILDSDIIDCVKTPPNADKIDTLYRQLCSEEISKNSDQDIVMINPKTPSKSKDVVQNQIAYETPSEIEVTQFYTQKDKSTEKKDIEDDSNNNQSNILNITARRSLRSDLVAKESVDSQISKVSKIKIKEEPIVKQVRCETETSTTVVEVPNKDFPIPKNNNSDHITQKEVIKSSTEIEKIKDNTIKSSDPIPKIVKSKNEVIKTRRSKILDIDLIDYAHISVDTTIPRKLRSEIVQKKTADVDDKSIDSQKKLLKVKVEVNDDADKSQHRQLRSEQTTLIEPEKIMTDILKNISKTNISFIPQTETVSQPVEKYSEIINAEENKINRLSRSTQKNVESKTNKASKSIEIDEKPKRNRSTSKPNEKSLNISTVGEPKAIRSVSKKRGEKSKEVIDVTDTVEEKITKIIKKTSIKPKNVKKVMKQTKKVSVATKIKEKLKKSVTKHNKIQPAKENKKVAIKIEDKNKPIGDLTKSLTNIIKNKVSVTRKSTKKTNQKPNKISEKISNKSNKKEPNATSKKKSRGRKTNAAKNAKDTDNLLSINSIKSEPAPIQEKNKLTQKKQEDFDEITVVTEKKMKKPKDNSARTLRSSFAPVLIKKEEPSEEPVAVVEKVVALIHSEPKPKPNNLETEIKSDIDVKPRILRSQHFNQIEDINEIKEVLPKRNIKKKDKEVGLSEKSKAITKNKKVIVTKNRKTKKTETTAKKKDIKVAGKSKIQKLTKTSKNNVLQQVKSKLKTSKNGNPLKKPVTKKKLASKEKLLNNEIIERIIEELKNTLFNQESVTNKVINKKSVPKKLLKKKEVVNRKLLLAKKKLLQTKAALQQKLRSARAAECSKIDKANTSSSSESKENNPPKQNPINNVEDESEEKATIYLVDSYLQEKKEELEEKKEEPEEKKSNKTDSIIIINDVTLHTNGKIVKKNLKRKNDTHLEESQSKKQFKSIINVPELNKKNDITVFDFDESEPEFVPLTHKSRKLKSSETKTRIVNNETLFNNELSMETPLNQVKTNMEKIKTELTLSNPRGRRPKLLVPSLDSDGKPKKLYSIIVPKTEPIQSIDISDSSKSTPIVSDCKSPEEVPDPRDKKSPLKQATIIEMFSKVWMKQEKPNMTKEENSTKSPTPKIISIPKVDPIAPSPRREYFEDDDSDTESRAEWIPEEYAEYKFKYTAQRMMQYKPIYKCKICQVLMPSYYKLFKHRKEHEQKDRPYSCPQCGSEFKEVDDFSAHLRVHKGKHPYECPKCDMGFLTKQAHDAHTLVHVLKKAKPTPKKFRCDVCSKEFRKVCDVERHLRVHTGEKPFTCNICNKKFQQSHNLSVHLFTHLHVKPFSCEICNKQFGRADVLRRHVLIHSVNKPIKCEICSKSFIRNSQLTSHLRRKHGDTRDVDLNADDEFNNEVEDNQNSV